MNVKPVISVLMPVHNADKTLNQAVWSVLNQSLEDFELLIYLDGCTDKSTEIIANFTDERIKVFADIENKGIVFGRNFLVQKATGKYIAWLDADDLMLPKRLSTQFNFLEVHPDIFILGSWVEVRNNKKVKQVKWPTSSDLLKTWLFFRNPLVQSSLMLRNERSKIKFESDFEYLEDYRFYSTIYLQNKIAIYPAFLCSYFQDSQTELIHKYRKYDFVGKLESIMKSNLTLLNIKLNSNELALLREFLRSNHRFKKTEQTLLLSIFKQINTANKIMHIFDPYSLQKILVYQCLRLLKNNGFMHLKTWAYIFIHPQYWFSFFFVGMKIKSK